MSAPELARPFPLERLASLATAAVVADAGECAAVAQRLLVPSVDSLRCDWTLRAAPRGVVVAEGRLQARLHRQCVVSLEDFPIAVDERFTVHFVPAGTESEEADDPEQPDELPYEGTALDLGEASVEQLALALDPYPRKPGAILPEDAAEPAANPFAALAGRRPRE